MPATPEETSAASQPEKFSAREKKMVIEQFPAESFWIRGFRGKFTVLQHAGKFHWRTTAKLDLSKPP
jgi:hypothetical protein